VQARRQRGPAVTRPSGRRALGRAVTRHVLNGAG
jgi:hypothetical protein